MGCPDGPRVGTNLVAAETLRMSLQTEERTFLGGGIVEERRGLLIKEPGSELILSPALTLLLASFACCISQAVEGESHRGGQ